MVSIIIFGTANDRKGRNSVWSWCPKKMSRDFLPNMVFYLYFFKSEELSRSFIFLFLESSYILLLVNAFTSACSMTVSPVTCSTTRYQWMLHGMKNLRRFETIPHRYSRKYLNLATQQRHFKYRPKPCYYCPKNLDTPQRLVVILLTWKTHFNY